MIHNISNRQIEMLMLMITIPFYYKTKNHINDLEKEQANWPMLLGINLQLCRIKFVTKQLKGEEKSYYITT